ncbi:hypothetical protein JX265_001293 [Neoarthrinium moseri]|uniref:Uncharacterized protein n=1 Tax=Neoarthrinium moseri TaxID=1658444 RepID=A0A9P9WXG0_9PEZI|nr:uncharacterized protein JN550_010743 [Neoarthrinium moseri]KAI1861673.1 hypothetical protein JN550_010743 [Neoarthrinium moseri]KAI1881053.1 hypothetical protein JX265_001293 [Neoarthrinium moseri]
MARDRDSDTSGAGGQSKRPPLNHHVSHDSDSQVSDHTTASSHRPKHHKHVVGGGGRLHSHSRVPSSKALHTKPHPHHATASTAKLQHHHRRHHSPSPERPERPDRPPMLSAAHRRTTSDVRLSRDSSSSNLRKNSSHTSLKRNRSHVEVAKKSKSAANIKRSSSHKDVSKLKGSKTTVHFDLGHDGQDDEWVDASASASPYLSRRGSVVSSGQGSAKPATSDNENEDDSNGDTVTSQSQSQTLPAASPDQDKATPDRERVQHKEYLTSRLLQRTPSHGAPPKMTADTAQVHPRTGSPDSAISRASSTLYGSPKPVGSAGVGRSADELTSRFVSGPGSGVNTETGSFYSPTRKLERVKRPRSLANIRHEHRDSITDDPDDDNDNDEDDSALAPRTRKPAHKAPPAEKSRTQQKLNLQRASSTIEPVPAGGGVGAVGASPLLGGAGYDNRDPRIGKLIERTGMEYLVVRRYQNPIARSIARLQQLPGAEKTLHIPKQNGSNGSAHSKKPSESGAVARYALSSSMGDAHRSRPVTPRRHTSLHINGANSSYEAEEERARISDPSYMGGEGDTVAALLRNLWDKNMDLSASQD